MSKQKKVESVEDWEAGRDLGQEILNGIKEFKAGNTTEHTITEIRSARATLGLSQSQFADKLNVSVRTLQNWEQGHREPSASTKSLIAQVLSDMDTESHATVSTGGAETDTLNDESLLLLTSIYHATENCILNALFYDATPMGQGEYWTMAQRNNALMCVQHWSTIFGARSETAHYTALFGSANVKKITGGTINSGSVKTHFQSVLSMNDKQYKDFHTQSHSARNQFISHRDDAADSILPDLDISMLQCFALRDKVIELLEYSMNNGDKNLSVKTQHNYYVNNGSRHGMLLRACSAIREYNNSEKLDISTEFHSKYKRMLTPEHT